MINQDDLKITINKKDYKLKITLGFWKNCGYKRDEASSINEDPEKLLKSIRLAIFYGNKEELGWKILTDMDELITEELLEDVDEDIAEKISFAMVYYLPKKLRATILKRMNEVDDQVIADTEKLIDDAASGQPTEPGQPEDSTDQKKN